MRPENLRWDRLTTGLMGVISPYATGPRFVLQRGYSSPPILAQRHHLWDHFLAALLLIGLPLLWKSSALLEKHADLAVMSKTLIRLNCSSRNIQLDASSGLKNSQGALGIQAGKNFLLSTSSWRSITESLRNTFSVSIANQAASLSVASPGPSLSIVNPGSSLPVIAFRPTLSIVTLDSSRFVIPLGASLPLPRAGSAHSREAA